MSDEVDRLTFDEAAREPIRKKLTRYMEENRIGLPTLAERITAANPEDEIQILTLQRFLAGEARTEDRYVALFHRFAESLT